MPTEFPIELPGIGTFYSDSEARLAYALTEMMLVRGVGNGGGGGGGGGDASAANQITEIARLTSILTELQGTLDVNIVSGGGGGGGDATAANQVTGNNSLASIDSKNPTLISGRVPVILPASSGTNPLLANGVILAVTTTNAILANGNFDTYSRLSFHLRGTWAGSIRCLMSGDNTTWEPVSVKNAQTNENFLDIETNGIFTVNAHARYFQLTTTGVFSGSVNGDFTLSTDDKSLEPPDKRFFSGSASTASVGNVLVAGNCENYSQISFTTFGTFTGSIRLQGTNRPEDSSSWQSISVKNVATNTGIGGDWGAGTIQVGDLCFRNFRIIVFGSGTGTVNVTGFLSKNPVPGNSLSVDTELAPPSALGDTISGSLTTATVGSAALVFNGTSFVRQRSSGTIGESIGRAKVSENSEIFTLASLTGNGTSAAIDLGMPFFNLYCQIIYPVEVTDFQMVIQGSLNNTNWDNLCTIPRIANGVKPTTGTLFNALNNSFSAQKIASFRFLRVVVSDFVGTGNIQIIASGTSSGFSPSSSGGDASAANQLTQIARLEALNNTCATAASIANSLTTTGTQVLADNANRKGLIIFNPLSVDVFIGFFTGTTSSTYTYKLTPGEGVEVLYRYTGIVHALVSAGTGSIQITELI